MNKQLASVVLASLMSTAAWAGEVGTVTEFTAGSPAVAADVNGNFQALITAINDNANRIVALENANTDSSVAGGSYQIISLNNELASGDGNGFSTVGNGSLAGVFNFDASNGSGSADFTSDALFSVSLPNNELQDLSDNTAETIPFTYTQSGNDVTITFMESDGNFDVNFIVSNDGSIMTARVIEPVGPTTFDDGSTGTTSFIELVIGIRNL